MGRTIDFSKWSSSRRRSAAAVQFLDGPDHRAAGCLSFHGRRTPPGSRDHPANLHRAPMYYGSDCRPRSALLSSIEDKVVRSAQDSHLIFSTGRTGTREYYCNGIRPPAKDVQQEGDAPAIRVWRNAEVMRLGVRGGVRLRASTQLKPDTGNQAIPGLYFAGQINGTTGYRKRRHKV